MNSKRRQERRSGIVIMGKLIGLIKPLFPIMLAAGWSFAWDLET